jgi:hypothetical protein
VERLDRGGRVEAAAADVEVEGGGAVVAADGKDGGGRVAGEFASTDPAAAARRSGEDLVAFALTRCACAALFGGGTGGEVGRAREVMVEWRNASDDEKSKNAI